MNNMKKALALVMSLALAASTFVVGAAYDDVPETHENRIAINLLGDLGVMVGDAGTNDFRPEGTLKRSEAAAIVYRLRTGKTNADSYVGNTGFSDVSDSHWASGYINYCVEQGIIAGYPDGTYKPDQEVTYAEYIKMVVCALNLQKVETTTYIDMNTGVLVSEDKITTSYPNGYIVLASDQQINEGIDYLTPNDKISRAEVAQGAYNAIFESYYKLDPKDADYVKDGTDYQHLAEQVFKLTKYKGVVTAYEDYTAGNDTQEGDHFYLESRDKHASDAYEYAEFDASWLGQEVYVWEKGRLESSATEPKVVAIVPTEDNKVTTVATNEVKKDGSDFYYTDAEGKKQTIKGDELGSTKLIINGEYYKGAVTAKELLSAVAENRVPMTLTFIDNDNSPKSPSYISVQVYAETEITSVTEDALYIKNIKDTYSFNDMEVDNQDGKTGANHAARTMYVNLMAAVDDDDANGVDVYDMNAGSIDLKNDDDTVNEKIKYYDGIAKGDKVMIYADANGNYDIRKIEEVEGTITLMSGSKYKVDDQELYVVSGDAMKSLMDTNLNAGVLAYVDPFTGYIVYATEGTGNVSDYYYVHMVQKQYATSKDYQLLAYDYEGNKVTLTFKDGDAQKEVLTTLLKMSDADYDTNVNTLTGTNNFVIADAIGILDVNSKGVISGWRSNNTDALVEDASYDKDAEYNTKTGYVTIDTKRVEIKPSSVVFGVTFENGDPEKIDEVKTYVGSFPKTTADIDSGVDYYLRKNDDDLKVALIHGKTKGGNTEFTNVTGYVLDETFEYTDSENKKGHAIYKIATKGEVKEYYTETVDDADLLDTLSKTHLKNYMIKFDLTTDGKIMYSEAADIETVGFTDSFKAVVNSYTPTMSGATVSSNVISPDEAKAVDKQVGLADFTNIYPGSLSVDEDEIYFGVVVEGKDEKFMQLVNKYGQSIIVDYADDVQVYVIDEDDWGKVKVGTTGNITDSNEAYTTYAAVRIVDGDDANDARITEVYTKTVKSNFYSLVNKEYGNSNGEFPVNGGIGQVTDQNLQSAANFILSDFGTPTYGKNGLDGSTNGNNPTTVGTVNIPANYNLSIKADVDADGNSTTKVTIGGVEYTIATSGVGTGLTAGHVAIVDKSTGNAVANLNGAAEAEILFYANGELAAQTLEIPMTLTDVNDPDKTMTVTLPVKVVNKEQSVVDAEQQKAENQAAVEQAIKDVEAQATNGVKTIAAADYDSITFLTAVTIGTGTDKVVYTVTGGDTTYAAASADGSSVAKGTAPAPTSTDKDKKVTVKAVATLGAGTDSEATAETTITIEIKATTTAQEGAAELAQLEIDGITLADSTSIEYKELPADYTYQVQPLNNTVSAVLNGNQLTVSATGNGSFKLIATDAEGNATPYTVAVTLTTAASDEAVDDFLATPMATGASYEDVLDGTASDVTMLGATGEAQVAALTALQTAWDELDDQAAAAKKLSTNNSVYKVNQQLKALATEAYANQFVENTVAGKTYAEVLKQSTVATAAADFATLDELKPIKDAWDALADIAGAQDKVVTLLAETHVNSIDNVNAHMGKIAGEVFLGIDTASSETCKSVLNVASGTVDLSKLADDAADYQANLNAIDTTWRALASDGWTGAQTYVKDALSTLNPANEAAVGDQIAKTQKAINADALNTVGTAVETAVKADSYFTMTWSALAEDGTVDAPANTDVTVTAGSAYYDTNPCTWNFSTITNLTDITVNWGTAEADKDTSISITPDLEAKTVTLDLPGDADYTLTSKNVEVVLTIGEGETAKTITLQLTGNMDYEA